MTLRRNMMLSAGVVLATVVPTLAHHAAQAQFDFTRETQFTGTIKRVEWINPHSYIHIDVKDAATGQVKTWSLETIALAGMRRVGVARNTLRTGDPLQVQVYLARNGTTFAFLKEMTLGDGRKITTWFGDPYGTDANQ